MTKDKNISENSSHCFEGVKSIALLISFVIFSFSAQAQTVFSPRLTCVINDFVGSNITIEWQNIPNGCGPFVGYKIFAANNINGPYVLLTTVTNQAQTSYTHSAALTSNPNWYYYLEADFNCPGATVLQSDTIQNESNPKVPQIINATVNPDNSVTFNWVPSESPQSKFYIVYAYLPGGGVVPIDTVYGRNNTSYQDFLQDPTQLSIGYTVSVGDSCVGNQPSAYNTSPHNTIFLEATVSRCVREVRMKWNKYANFPDGVYEYRVYVDRNLAGYTYAGAVDSNTTTFGYIDFNDNDTLCLTVAAVSAKDTNIIAYSNYLCFRPSIVQPADYVHLTRISVNPDNTIDLNWLTDDKAALRVHEITNSYDCNSFLTTQTIRNAIPNLLNYAYIDSAANGSEAPVCYIVNAYDSCQVMKESEKGRSVHLIAELTDYYEIKIDWTAYEIFGANVLRYTLYRNYGVGWQVLGTFNPNELSFRDSLYQFLSERGEFCYYVEVEYQLTLPDVPYDTILKATSNRVCLFHRPIIYIPNAFVPGGVNNVFKPTIFFGDPSNYSMTIFNRYGGRVFETNDPGAGWDGTDRGKPVQQGGYAYLIKFTAADGVNIERKGIVVLVRN